MSVISGKAAVMTGIGTLRNWEITTTDTIHEPRASNTDAYPYGVVGNNDWTGKAAFYGHIPLAYPGSAITFVGAEEVTSTDTWTGAALVSLFRVRIPTNEAKPIEGYIEFASNGALSNSTGSLSDATSPTIYASKSMGATFAGSAVADVEYMEFTMTCDLQAYVSSDTAGITKRVAGHRSVTGQFGVLQTAVASILAPGTIDVLKYYVTPTTFFQFSYAVLQTVTVVGDREGGTLGRKVYPWTFSGWKAGTKGTILLPDTSAYWS